MKRRNISPRDLAQPKPTLVPRLRVTFPIPRLALLENGRGRNFRLRLVQP